MDVQIPGEGASYDNAKIFFFGDESQSRPIQDVHKIDRDLFPSHCERLAFRGIKLDVIA